MRLLFLNMRPIRKSPATFSGNRTGPLRKQGATSVTLYRRGLPASWGVVHRETGRVIGTIGFMWYSDVNCSAEVGYSFSRAFWNAGYATEALRAVISSVFSSLPLNRLEAQHDVRNPASGRVMEKCGMRNEGILRQRVRNKDEFIDTVLWSLLRSDLE